MHLSEDALLDGVVTLGVRHAYAWTSHAETPEKDLFCHLANLQRRRTACGTRKDTFEDNRQRSDRNTSGFVASLETLDGRRQLGEKNARALELI